MPRANLTDLTVRSLKEGTYFDTKTPAFGIRVGKQRKTWLVVRGKTRTKTVLGHFPQVSLSDARTAARRLLLSQPDERPQIVTFADARESYLREHSGRVGTKKELTRLLTKHFAPFDAKNVTTITDRDVQKQLENLAPSEKLHAFRAIRAAFRWFTRPPRRYVTHSPLEGFAPPGRDGRRTRVLSDTEVARVLAHSGGQSGAVVRLMLLWGTRRTETLALRRDWIADGVLTIPADITKSARPHTIPILPLAQSVLDNIPNRGVYFFGGERKPTVHINIATWTKMHQAILKASETSGWSAHDLRRTFRSSCARLRVSRELAERLLNHTQGALDEIYDHHDYVEEKRTALAKIETWISALSTTEAMLELPE